MNRHGTPAKSTIIFNTYKQITPAQPDRCPISLRTPEGISPLLHFPSTMGDAIESGDRSGASDVTRRPAHGTGGKRRRGEEVVDVVA